MIRRRIAAAVSQRGSDGGQVVQRVILISLCRHRMSIRILWQSASCHRILRQAVAGIVAVLFLFGRATLPLRATGSQQAVLLPGLRDCERNPSVVGNGTAGFPAKIVVRQHRSQRGLHGAVCPVCHHLSAQATQRIVLQASRQGLIRNCRYTTVRVPAIRCLCAGNIGVDHRLTGQRAVVRCFTGSTFQSKRLPLQVAGRIPHILVLCFTFLRRQQLSGTAVVAERLRHVVRCQAVHHVAKFGNIGVLQCFS
ncbi:hypothetical protein [Xenorhabdus khoisanae]|uniref:hypothetical protein n=1 Tax=Xenorhabdus khoisanae TaxID=880157 RepID=UPI003983FB86